MLERLLLVITLIFSLITFAVAAQVPAASEKDVYRPDKNEIIALMNQASKMPAAQQNERADAALKGISTSGSKTPRSDFLLCMGLAHLGNAKAQRCVGFAYEKGIGVVDDMMEAYAWFELANGNGNAESKSDAARALLILNSAYPAPSEEELELMVTTQKRKNAEYQKEVKK
jgi:TPR repeat protein